MNYKNVFHSTYELRCHRSHDGRARRTGFKPRVDPLEDIVLLSAVAKFAVTGFPLSTTAGVPGSVTVEALDATGQLVNDYAGTIRFTSTDSKATLPANYTFNATDGGMHTFDVTLYSPGNRSITVIDTTNPSITGKQGNLVVSAAAASYFVVSDFPNSTAAGAESTFTVTAKDPFGNVATAYAGTVSFTSTDPLASLPSGYTFTATDAGSHTFTSTLYTAGSQSIAATDADTSSITGKHSSIQVNPLAATSLVVSGYPSPTVTALPQKFVVEARDPYGNLDKSYDGTVHFTSTDPLASMPDDFTFTAADGGDKIFSATFKTPGTQVITATDIATPSITGSQTGIQVNASPVRYASSTNTIYVEEPIVITLSEIDQLLPKAPLDLVDPVNRVWFLGANLVAVNGATLLLHGTAIGGDVNELRLLSANTGATNSLVRIEANWGNIDIDTTKITSWDPAANGGLGGPDTEYSTYNRAFIRARSFLEADGVTARESRMDIKNSDIGYLGYHGAEAYGLSWKVNGNFGAAVVDAAGNPTYELFEKVNVYGDTKNNHIHNNYFGIFTYGAYGMQILDNEVDHNVVYGIDPHDDSDFLTIMGNNAHHNGTHGIIGSQRCNNLVIKSNVSWANGRHGIMIHRRTNNALVEDNYVYDNAEDGIAIFDSHNSIIRNNLVVNNLNGIRFSVGSSNNLVTDNQVINSGKHGIKFFKGNDLPADGDGRPHDNVITNNLIQGSVNKAVYIEDADNNVFSFNTFIADQGWIEILRGGDNVFVGNSLPPDLLISTRSDETFSSRTLIRDQAQMLIQVDTLSTVVIEDAEGRVFEIDKDGIATTISSSGSSLVLTYAIIGEYPVLVSELNFTALITSGDTASILPTLWETSDSYRKKWSTRASNSTASVTYTIGDLLPNTSYKITKKGKLLLKVTSDSSGQIVFTDVVDRSGNVVYGISKSR